MVKTISKIGNLHGLIFDAELMAITNLKPGDQLNVKVDDGRTITLTPVRKSPKRSEISRVIKSTIKTYEKSMKKLA